MQKNRHNSLLRWTSVGLMLTVGLFGSSTVCAQAFTEGFDDVAAALSTGGWTSVQRSAPAAGTTTWFQGADATFPAFSGAPTSYIGANFNATTGGPDGDAGTISLWLLAPARTINNGDTIRFHTRRTGSTFPDRLQVRINPTGGNSTNVGATELTVGDYTQLLLDINPTYNNTAYPATWTQQQIIVTGLSGPTTARIAFRYFVEDLAGPNGNRSDYIGIDNVIFTPSTTGATADMAAVRPTGEYTLIPRTQRTNMPVECLVQNVGAAAANNVGMAVRLFRSSNNFSAPVQTFNATPVATVAGGASTTLNAGTYFPPDTGVYVFEYVVSATNNTNVSNDTTFYIFAVTDSTMARDDFDFSGEATASVGLANAGPTGATANIGQFFTLSNQAELTSVEFAGQFANSGDSIRVAIFTVGAGNAIGATPIATSNHYILTAADLGGRFFTLPLSTPTTANAGTYYVAVQKFTTTDSFYVFRTESIFTANRGFFNINGGAYSSLDGIILEPIIVRPNMRAVCNISATASTTAATCTASNGSVTLTTPTGGTAPYTYVWNGGATTQNLTGVPAGNYNVTITDANACTRNVTATVASNNITLTVNTGVTATGCGTSTGAATATVSGGTMPYTYLWSNTGNTQTISNLAAGGYGVTATDANGCQGTGSASINTATGPTGSGSASSPSCFGGNNGSINLTVSGGTAPISYVWNTGETTQNLSNLSAGTFSVTIADNAGCDFVINGIQVTNPSQISVTGSTTAATCGNANGQVNISATGGTGAFTFNWSNNAITQNLSAVAPNTYTVTVTDANGCTAVSNGFTVANTGGASVTATVVNVSCLDADNGSITLSLAGGTTPYTFLWNNGLTTQNLSGLSSGTYAVTVTDNTGCATIQSNINVTTGTGPTVTATSTNATSANNDGTATATATGGTAPYTYLWNNGATTASLTGLAAGTYGVTVTDANGCVGSTSVTVTLLSSIQSNLQSLGVQLFPNPTAGQFELAIRLAESQDVSIQLLDLTGRVLQQTEHVLVQEANIPMDIRHLPAGMYFVRIMAGQEVATQKVIRQ